jgi:hypothetical protein
MMTLGAKSSERTAAAFSGICLNQASLIEAQNVRSACSVGAMIVSAVWRLPGRLHPSDVFQ